MNRNRCSSGRRPERVAPSGRARPRAAARLATALLLSALLAAAAAGLRPLRAQPADALAACPQGKELCVRAERSGGIDLKSGVAHLEGDVQGVMRSRELAFSGEMLTAFRNGGQEWVRLVLDHDVRVRQQDRRSESDHGVLEHDEIRLSGHVRIDHADMHLEGHEALMRSDGSRTVLHGLPDTPLTLVVQRPLIAPEEGAPQEGVSTTVHSQKAIVEEQPRRVTLTGSVHVEQSDGRLRMDAQQVTLYFEGDELESFRAEGNVTIAQPDRRVTADVAQSRNQLKTILLVGHATLQQQGTFDLKSDRMEVYADSSKGVVQSQDRQKPITLSLDLAGGQSYGLTQAGMLKLSGMGVPPPVLEKLAPLIGQTYPSRAAFREAVSRHLSRRETDRHMDTILSNAR
jgi:lipopolysaccharide export system protein LptA